MKKKILLIRPPEPLSDTFARFYEIYESLGLGYIAASLRDAGHYVEIFDCYVEEATSEGSIKKKLEQSDFDVAGISVATSLVFPQALTIARAIKQKSPNIPVIMGGHHPTLFYDPILKRHPEIDIIVRHEGESTLRELMDSIRQPWDYMAYKDIKGLAYRNKDKIVTNPLRPLIEDLDTLPFPARDTLPMVLKRGGFPLVSTSRGCHGYCSFCDVHMFYKAPQGKPWRGRSPENILEEIEMLHKEFGCQEIWFIDDNFLGVGDQGINRISKLMNLIKAKNISLKRMDFSCRPDGVIEGVSLVKKIVERRNCLIYVGVEAGVQRILDIYQKGVTVEQNRKAVKIIKESGGNIKMEFILFNPWIKLEEVKETLAFLEDVEVYDPYILTSTLSIMKQTPLAQKVERKELPIKPLTLDEKDDNFFYFIPYKIIDECVDTLFQIVQATIPRLEPALRELHKFKTFMKSLDDESLQEEYQDDYETHMRLINEIALFLFKRALTYVETNPCSGNDEETKEFIRELAEKTSVSSALVKYSLDELKDELASAK